MSTPLNTHESWTSWIESGHWAESSDTAMPMLPAIAGDVMGLAMDPEVSIARIARVIAKDQVLATRVLRLANSAYCAPMQGRHTRARQRSPYVANRLSHRYGFGCPTDDANLLEDEIAVRAGLTESMLGDLDRRAPGLFQAARQIVA